jgi:hypothetical protein
VTKLQTPSTTNEPIKCLSKVLDGTHVTCGLGIGGRPDVVFKVSFNSTTMSLVLSFKSWKLTKQCIHELLCNFTHLKLALHKLISGKLCVFLMYMYIWDIKIWCPNSLWCSSFLPLRQQGAFLFRVERTKRLWHHCSSSSSISNRTWTRCESINLNYLLNGNLVAKNLSATLAYCVVT